MIIIVIIIVWRMCVCVCVCVCVCAAVLQSRRSQLCLRHVASETALLERVSPRRGKMQRRHVANQPTAGDVCRSATRAHVILSRQAAAATARPHSASYAPPPGSLAQRLCQKSPSTDSSAYCPHDARRRGMKQRINRINSTPKRRQTACLLIRE